MISDILRTMPLSLLKASSLCITKHTALLKISYQKKRKIEHAAKHTTFMKNRLLSKNVTYIPNGCVQNTYIFKADQENKTYAQKL